jgi:hypothetical protein
MANIEDFRSAGVLPTGPVSAWPRERHEDLFQQSAIEEPAVAHDKHVKATAGQMVRGLASSVTQVLSGGRVTEEIRDERYDTCKGCPHFIEESKRCSECGCFMEAKTWIGGDPKTLCPKKKWKR